MTKKIFNLSLKMSFWATVVLLAMGQLQRIQLSERVAIYGHEFAMMLFVVMSLAYSDHLRKLLRQIYSSVLVQLLTIYLVGLVLYWGMSGQYLVGAYLMRLTLYLCFLLSLRSNLVITAKQKVAAVILVGLVTIGWGLWQYCFLPDLRFLAAFGWDEHYYRWVGLSFDPNFSGILLILLGIFWAHLTQSLPKLYRWMVLVILSACLFLTFSRASYLSAIVVGSWVAWPKDKKHFIKLLGMVLLIGLTIGLSWLKIHQVGGEGVNLLRTNSIWARIEYDRAWVNQLSFQQILTGNGLKNPVTNPNLTNPQSKQLPPINHANLPNNLFVLIQSGGGLIGTLLLVGVLIQIYKTRSFNTYQFATLLAVLIHSQFNNTLLNPIVLPNLILIWTGLEYSVVSSRDHTELKLKVD